jgi:hypothetical protein
VLQGAGCGVCMSNDNSSSRRVYDASGMIQLKVPSAWAIGDARKRGLGVMSRTRVCGGVVCTKRWCVWKGCMAVLERTVPHASGICIGVWVLPACAETRC